MSRYLRQIVRQATGRNLPGQVRPLFRSMVAFAARRDPEQPFDEIILEQQEPVEEAVARPHALPVSPGIAGASLTPPVPPALAVLSRRPEATAGEPIPTKAERAARPGAGSEPSFAPTSSHRLDSIEALQPSRGVDEGSHISPREAVRNESPPLRDGSSTASAQSVERQRNTERRQPEVGLLGRPASASVPEIHIHIGRVELTALQAASAKSTPRNIGKRPMSLDDYLRQRDERRT